MSVIKWKNINVDVNNLEVDASGNLVQSVAGNSWLRLEVPHQDWTSVTVRFSSSAFTVWQAGYRDEIAGVDAICAARTMGSLPPDPTFAVWRPQSNEVMVEGTVWAGCTAAVYPDRKVLLNILNGVDVVISDVEFECNGVVCSRCESCSDPLSGGCVADVVCGVGEVCDPVLGCVVAKKSFLVWWLLGGVVVAGVVGWMMFRGKR